MNDIAEAEITVAPLGSAAWVLAIRYECETHLSLHRDEMGGLEKLAAYCERMWSLVFMNGEPMPANIHARNATFFDHAEDAEWHLERVTVTA